MYKRQPGGSPVQSGIINDEIRRLRLKYPEKPLYVVVDDLCASGGYYIAAAADKIYVNKASVIGSIGVLMDGFGFTGTMEMCIRDRMHAIGKRPSRRRYVQLEACVMSYWSVATRLKWRFA